ncbi:hypothetical protein MMC29_003812 [Sticta canariensis]|nr:hypothetical protein [Sticta canariensis]
MNEQTRPSRVRIPYPRVRALTVSYSKSDYGPVQQAEVSEDEFEDSVSNDTAIEKSRAPEDSDRHQCLFSPLFAQRIEMIFSQAHRHLPIAHMKLKGYVVTETPSLGDSGNEDERDSAAGFEKNHTRFNSHEAMNSPFSINMLASRATSSLGASSSRSDATAYFTSGPSGESGVEQDAARESHLAYTLARLEGRVPPSSPSPIQRHVHPEWRYDDNVEVEHSGPVLRCPRPIRKANRVRLGWLFYVEAVDEFGGLELHRSASNDIPSERLANLTLDYAIFS